MTLIAPDILQDVHPLHPALLGVGLLAGVLWWLGGARAYRLWLVFGCTAGAGVLGLVWGPTLHVPPLVLGLLMAASAGVLAVSLVRPVAFLSGGAAAWVLAHAAVPSWEEPFVLFFAGGLLALALFRLWVTLASSLAGTVLGTYCLLGLLHRYAKLDTVTWSAKQATLLSCLVAGVTVLGVLTQFHLARRAAQKRQAAADAAERDREGEAAALRLAEAEARGLARRARKAKKWWQSLPPFRKAG